MNDVKSSTEFNNTANDRLSTTALIRNLTVKVATLI